MVCGTDHKLGAQRERMMITPNACRARELYDAAGPAQQAGIFGSGRQTGQ